MFKTATVQVEHHGVDSYDTEPSGGLQNVS